MPTLIFNCPNIQFAVIGFNQRMLPVFLGLLLTATIAWFFLSSRLYRTLDHLYPEIYENLGRPKLFMEKSLATNYRILQFLLRKEYESTGDPAVVSICRGMRAILSVYFICLAGSAILLADKFF